MKSVGNLTDFVRRHMLEPFDARPRIEALLAHFDDLNRAHEAILDAKRQLERLTPLIADVGARDREAQQNDEARAARGALGTYFAGVKDELLGQRLQKLEQEAARIAARLGEAEEKRRALRLREQELDRSIAANGGDRIAELEGLVAAAIAESERKRTRWRTYTELVGRIGLEPAGDLESFLAQGEEIERTRQSAEARAAELQNARTELGVQRRLEGEEQGRLTSEIEGLRARRSSIPERQVELRRELAAAVGVREDEMPFAGELIQVQGDARDWEGAAERLLHGFALSLLVPEEAYDAVAAWVDRSHLRGRLVYYRVRTTAAVPPSELHPRSIVHALALKHDSPFAPWLEHELARRFDLARCDDLAQFRREARAITRSGQIKGHGGRHEKDDRHRIDDRRRFVLGWTNERKIAALEAAAKEGAERLADLDRRLAAAQDEERQLGGRREALARLADYRDHRELDWRPHAHEAERLKDEKRRLEEASDALRELTTALRETEAEGRDVDERLQTLRDERSRTDERKRVATDLRTQAREVLDAPDASDHAPHLERVDGYRQEVLGDRALTVESCDAVERDLRDRLQARIDAADKRLEVLGQRIVRAMSDFRAAFPGASKEMDASLAAAPAYRELLDRLRSDDLPRFEDRFKRLLNENTIHEIANFQAQLNRERDTIKERIDRINVSLRAIDYNPGRFIELKAQPSVDAEIRDFRSELRACTEGTSLGVEDEPYSERKFLQIKRIIERFRGRDGLTEPDRRWTAKVTDVRTWFVFAASERWRETDEEHEHYSDSAGKSGGQKEKLAYTVLAASLAYRFGLETGKVRSRSFRFVTIDEAFGRGSDESARYGLQLFGSLGLQLLVATPLQKIHVIEPFVSSVGFVHSRDGRESQLRNLTIEEYRSERARHREADAAFVDAPSTREPSTREPSTREP
ncbi:MAG: SbcC/MukB-like Walker B domain-containing protein [Acidimicrobiales bacterium]|nr:SbcC/MukB-like Walker B domain-containing protein [Acidimicrobiales bacterium]